LTYNTFVFFIMFFLILCLTYAHGISNQVFGTTAQTISGQTMFDPTLKVEKVFEGKGFFATMAFLGPDDILVVDKNYGTVHRIVNGNLLKDPLLDLKVANRIERGLVGIAVASKHGIIAENNGNGTSNEDKYIFLYFTEAKSHDGDDRTGNNPLGNMLYRYELINNNTKLGNSKLLLKIPALPGPAHNGGAMAIGPDRNLYIIIGNLNDGENRTFWTMAENSKNGSVPDGRAGILRLTQDGEPVNEHGILGDSMPLKLYYAYGIRNGFGLAFDPVTGKLWDTENGGSYGDEINIVEPGFNSGWHKVQGMWERTSGGMGNISVTPRDLEDFNGKGKYSPPEFMWYKTVGVTGLAFLNSDKLGEQYKNDLFVGDYHTGILYHFDLNKERTKLSVFDQLKDNITMGHDDLGEVTFGQGFGRTTDIKVGPDGYLYVLSHLTEGSDCNPKFPTELCIPSSAPNVSTIFKIQLR
jgi:aldose sugar dehydrogenase